MQINPRNRLFIALEPTHESRALLAEISEAVAVRHKGRAPPSRNLHVTLAFLGQTEPEAADALLEGLAERLAGPVARARGIELATRPPRGRAHLLALSLEGDDERLLGLFAATERLVSSASSSSGNSPVTPWPHVTLARFRPPRRLDVRGGGHDLTHREQVFAFDRASLYNSEPQRVGPPRYRALATVQFR